MLIEQQTIASGSITVPGTYLCQSCIDDQPQSTDWKVSFPSIIAILGARRRLAPLELPLPANILVPWEFSTLNLTQSSSGFFPFSPGTRYLISPAPPPLGWLFHERTRILSGIHFTRHFIEFVVVETKLFVGSNVTVILTRPVLDQGYAKQTALCENYFDERICHLFLISKCRGDLDLGLCTLWVLAKREPLRHGNFRTKRCFARRKNRNLALRSGSLFASTPNVHRPADLVLSLLYILRKGTYGKYASTNNFLALGICFPRTRTSAGRMFAGPRSRLHYY